jgi:hypothetical protein
MGCADSWTQEDEDNLAIGTLDVALHPLEQGEWHKKAAFAGSNALCFHCGNPIEDAALFFWNATARLAYHPACVREAVELCEAEEP